MGSGSSKSRGGVEGGAGTASCASSTSSFTSSPERRKKGGGFFGVSCLGSTSGAYESSDDAAAAAGYDDDDDDDQVSDHHDEPSATTIQQTESESGVVKVERYRKVKTDGPDNRPCVSSNVEFGEWAHASGANDMTGADGSSSQALTGRPVNHSSRFLSRFSFVPGSVSFRLSRAASVGSSRAYPSSPTSFAISSVEEDLHLNPSSLTSATIRARGGDSSADLTRNPLVSTMSRSFRDNQVISAQDLVDNHSERSSSSVCLPSFGNRADIESPNRRVIDRRNGAREPAERNVRFSRTLSVGRLRDRVLRRSSFSDLTLSPLHQGRTGASDENPVNSLLSPPYPMPNILNRFYSSQSNEIETLNSRDSRQQDLLEHRSNFLERRRRIRSQVRALQRLGSRFENLSGHERNCILSGQHRTGRCSCRVNTRDSSSNDDGGARASISRIVMLAEALFEVLDEIHQQSVVLSSRPSVSSIGSVPAPNEAVESLPVKIYTKSMKLQTEEVAQCYICLVEYEEGDDMRILPCHHEFHKKCIDKWLKEIHRVCPLCRGDICRSDVLPLEG